MAIYLIDYENVHDAGLDGIGRLKKEDKVIVFYGINIKAIPFDRHVEMMNSKADIEFIKTAKVAKNYLDFQLTTYLGYLVGKGEKGPLYVVSKDTGFDSVIDFWKGRNVEIKRVLNLQLDKPVVAAAKATGDTKAKNTAVKKTESTKRAVSKSKNSTKNADDIIKEAKEKAPVAKKEIAVKKAPSMPEAFRKKIRAAVKKENLQASKYTSIYKAMESATNHADYKNRITTVLGKDQGESVYNHTQIIYSEYKVILEE